MLEGRPFAIPDQLRRLWESNLEQARLAYGQFVDMIARANALLTGVMPTSEAASGYEEIQQRTVQFAKQNADVYFSFVDDLTKANDLQEAFSNSEPLCANPDAAFYGSSARAWSPHS